MQDAYTVQACMPKVSTEALESLIRKISRFSCRPESGPSRLKLLVDIKLVYGCSDPLPKWSRVLAKLTVAQIAFYLIRRFAIKPSERSHPNSLKSFPVFSHPCQGLAGALVSLDFLTETVTLDRSINANCYIPTISFPLPLPNYQSRVKIIIIKFSPYSSYFLFLFHQIILFYTLLLLSSFVRRLGENPTPTHIVIHIYNNRSFVYFSLQLLCCRGRAGTVRTDRQSFPCIFLLRECNFVLLPFSSSI